MNKTKIFHLLLMTAIALTATTLVSCTDDDNVAQQPTDKVRAQLVGTWYGEYATAGEITSSAAGSIPGFYIKTVQGLEFKSDGTGICYQYLCNVAGEPLSIYGGTQDTANGQFKYTVGEDSSITITRVGEGDATHPKTWRLAYDAEGLCGTDGEKAYVMHPSKEWQQNNLTAWEVALRSGSNVDATDKSFINNWENLQSVELSKLGPRYLPWYGSASQDIPEEIIFDMKKRDGWEMAFCELNDPDAPDILMFGLYNRFTGVLRVYQYLEGDNGWGNGLMLHVSTASKTNVRYPYYNNMTYSIPMNHEYGSTNLLDNVDIWNGAEYFTPFEYMVSAYSVYHQSQTIVPHWHCFDLDFSAYVPKRVKVNGTEVNFDWRHSVDSQRTLMQLNVSALKTGTIDLWGTMIGDMAGQFNSMGFNKSSCANPKMKTASTVLGIAGTFFSQCLQFGNHCLSITKNSPWGKNNGQDNGNQDNGNQGGNPVDDEGDGNIVNNDEGGGAPAFQGPRRVWMAIPWVLAALAGACTLTSSILNAVNPTTSWQETNGNATFCINTNVQMQGTIDSYQSLPCGGVSLTPFLLDASNPNGNFGKGCFGLTEDPVVYVSTEDLLSSSARVNLTLKNGEFESVNFKNDSLRLVSFFDPSSVKFMLNTDIYHNISDLTVTLNYGVDAANETGNTDGYRTFMGLNKRGTFKMKEKLSSGSTPRLHVINPYSLLSEEPGIQGSPDSIRMVLQRGGKFLRFFGNCNSYYGKNCMMDPQVFVPYNGSKVYEALVPDFFVSVTVTFKCDECEQVEICRAYVPKVVFIKHKDLATWYDKLKDYSDKCSDGRPVGTLVNDPSIEVYDYGSDQFLIKNLKMLKKIK